MNNEILLCNFERQNEINKRILERNIPFCNRNNPINIRPECTKYTFPIFTYNDDSKCFNINDVKFKNEDCFKRYSSNIDIESVLKNQDKKLNNNPNNKYIPSSASDLYINNIQQTDNTSELLYPYLFNKNIVNEKDSRNNIFPNKLFNTDTRQDLKN
mgnify:CR=1 FL=1